MRKSLLRTLENILFVIVLACPLLLAACSGDVADDVDVPETVSLTLQITTKDEGDLNTRADFEGEEEGRDHEFIHQLCVLFVQNGTVVKKILPDFENNAAAQKGNLRTYTETITGLNAGTYTVYAFANIHSDYGPDWASITGIGEGEEISGINLDKIVLNDPASKIKFDEDRFIPMSATKEINVPSSGTISIGLDRLVCKVRMSVRGKEGDALRSVKFGGYDDKVSLFSDHKLTDVDTLAHTVTFGDDGQTFGDGAINVQDFYVNVAEANTSQPFDVEVVTSDKNGTVFRAQTTATEMPRNSILPLNLTLNYYGLQLSGWYRVAPIGSYPVQFDAAFDADTYNVSLPEGSQFGFTIGGVQLDDGTPEVTDLTCSWAIDPNVVSRGFTFNEGTDLNGQTVEGHVTAIAGQTYPFTAQVTWTANGTPYNRTYTVNVTTTDISEVNFSQGTVVTRAASGTAACTLKPEVLNMLRK